MLIIDEQKSSLHTTYDARVSSRLNSQKLLAWLCPKEKTSPLTQVTGLAKKYYPKLYIIIFTYLHEEDHEIFDNIDSISLTTIMGTLSKHRVWMKQLYTVPFERNSERVKELRQQYVQV